MTRDVMRGFELTERELRELCELPLDEALARIRRQHQAAHQWAADRARFLEGEVRAAERSRNQGSV